jgi:hypothetical protein
VNDFGRVWIDDKLIIDSWKGGSGNDHNFDEVKIMNIQGTIIYQSMASAHELELDISDWSCGLYLVEVRSMHERFVKKSWLNSKPIIENVFITSL